VSRRVPCYIVLSLPVCVACVVVGKREAKKKVNVAPHIIIRHQHQHQQECWTEWQAQVVFVWRDVSSKVTFSFTR